MKKNIPKYGTITKEDFEAKKRSLKDRPFKIGDLQRAYDQTDDDFSNRLKALVLLASDAAAAFKSSEIDGNREWLTFILQNRQSRGRKLEFSLRFPFSKFAECAKTGEWR
ncbi:MAG: recombinase family protein, partial [Pseudomonadota bacterium]|nr:recombinase family protein [Pseudomonadota bacterium]